MRQIPTLLILASLLLIACGGTPAPDLEATVQAARAATQTAQPTDTPTSTPNNTSILTNTPKPTDTPTATPTNMLEPSTTPTDTPTLPDTSTPEPTDTSTLVPPTPEPLDTPTPAIVSFVVSPLEIQQGDPVTLTWNVVAEQAKIWVLDYKMRLTNTFFSVPLSGTTVLTYPYGGSFYLELLAISGNSEKSARAEVRVLPPENVPTLTHTPSVSLSTPMPGCEYAWFFSNPPKACPLQPTVYTTLVAQHFEHGMMLWHVGVIHIFFSDDLQPSWDVTSDAWFSGVPEYDPQIIPPSGYYQPVRGFGMLWRQGRIGDYKVRDRLGWATDAEFFIGEGAEQCYFDASLHCFVTGPDNAIYATTEYPKRWYVWTGQPSIP